MAESRLLAEPKCPAFSMSSEVRQNICAPQALGRKDCAGFSPLKGDNAGFGSLRLDLFQIDFQDDVSPSIFLMSRRISLKSYSQVA
jgi:hypothetical protein